MLGGGTYRTSAPLSFTFLSVIVVFPASLLGPILLGSLLAYGWILLLVLQLSIVFIFFRRIYVEVDFDLAQLSFYNGFHLWCCPLSEIDRFAFSLARSEFRGGQPMLRVYVFGSRDPVTLVGGMQPLLGISDYEEFRACLDWNFRVDYEPGFYRSARSIFQRPTGVWKTWSTHMVD
jgi:hypothetical protein